MAQQQAKHQTRAQSLLSQLWAAGLHEGEQAIERAQQQLHRTRVIPTELKLYLGLCALTLLASMVALVSAPGLPFTVVAIMLAVSVVTPAVLLGRHWDRALFHRRVLESQTQLAAHRSYDTLRDFLRFPEIRAYMDSLYRSGRAELTVFEARILEEVGRQLDAASRAGELRQMLLGKEEPADTACARTLERA